ncbi:hypothetical protein ACN9MC_31625 [Ensifer adhaerens]|uniref:hypothetical protein n=1 Tax=Ensifer adhaerens TaxID=106592 RepID=UPI003CEF9EBD
MIPWAMVMVFDTAMSRIHESPSPGSDEENADEELDDDEEDEISPREPEPDEEDPDLPARE